MQPFRKGRYEVRLAVTAADLRAAQHLRWLAFRHRLAGPAPAQGADTGPTTDPTNDPTTGRDEDAFDPRCRHVLVEDLVTGGLVCCFRLLPLQRGADIGQSYSAQYYELSGLAAFAGPIVEIGRFCLHPEVHDPDILRVAWGAMTRYVDASGAELLFGCTSFAGTEAGAYLDAFAMLKERHLAPRRWLPQVRAPEVFRFARVLRQRKPDARRAMLAMPPLLRSYLAMGGWVSDHAVVDRDLGTLHVFTGLEIRAIPPGRARLLRAVAG